MKRAESNQDHPEASKLKIRGRWRRITALSIAFFYALMGWVRLRESIRYYSYLQSIQLYPGPLYIAISGSAAGAVFTAAFFLILFRSRIAPFYARIVSLVYIAWWWADRIWLGRPEAFERQVFLTTLVTLVTLIFAFILVRKKDIPEERMTI